MHAAIFMLANVGEWSGRVAYLLGFAARIPRLYIAEQRDRRLLNTTLFEAFKGVSRDRLLSIGEEYCERILIGHLFPRGLELIEANRAAGIEPVLVTGSPDFIVAPLARHLGVADFAANRFVFSRGRATGRLAEPVMAGRRKSGVVRGLRRASAISIWRIAGVTPTRITTPRFWPRSGIPWPSIPTADCAQPRSAGNGR